MHFSDRSAKCTRRRFVIDRIRSRIELLELSLLLLIPVSNQTGHIDARIRMKINSIMLVAPLSCCLKEFVHILFTVLHIDKKNRTIKGDKMPYVLIYAEKPNGDAKWDMSDLIMDGVMTSEVERSMCEAVKVQSVLNVLEMYGWRVRDSLFDNTKLSNQFTGGQFVRISRAERHEAILLDNA